MNQQGWIGCDLDGTLAEYNGWVSPTHIGAPVPKMVERIKQHIADGKTVKIFTARVYFGSGDIARAMEAHAAKLAIIEWCKEHIGVALEVTCTKDYGMIFCYDDRAKQVIPNEGDVLEEEYKEAVENYTASQLKLAEVAFRLAGLEK